MKKSVIALLIVLAGIIITSCAFNVVHYCPYCKSADITQIETGVYKCNNSSCGKTFGAKEL